MRAVLYFRESLFKSNKNKFSFRRVESDKSFRKRSVVEHFVSECCWSGNLMDGRRGKVVCHLHKGGDLKKEIKQKKSKSTERGCIHDKE